MRARRALKTALADKWDTPAEEQERIARILERAAEEIGGQQEGARIEAAGEVAGADAGALGAPMS